MEKNRVPTFRGLCFFQFWKKTESTASPPPPCQGHCFFFRVEIFGLLSPSLPLVSLSQGFGYGFPACNGIIICTRPNILKTLLRKRATYSWLLTFPPDMRRFHQQVFSFVWQGVSNCPTRWFQLSDKVVPIVRQGGFNCPTRWFQLSDKICPFGQLEPLCRANRTTLD